MTVNEAIEKAGKLIVPDFNLDEPKLLKSYAAVFDTLKMTLGDNKRAKGVLLIGSKGVGKSVCMRVMGVLFRNTPRYFQYARTRDIMKELEWRKADEIMYDLGFELKKDLYLDDIGLAQAVKNDYGNKFNLISELLIDRYELFIREGYKTHMSSNRLFSVDRNEYPNDPPTLEDLYGDVVCDRLREMNNIILWQGQSLRTSTGLVIQ